MWDRLMRFLAALMESIESLTDAMVFVSWDCRIELSPELLLEMF